MSAMNVPKNKISKPINIPSRESDKLKAMSSFIPPMSYFPTKMITIWDLRKNIHGRKWEENFERWSKDISKSVRQEWDTKIDLVNREKNLRSKLALIVPLLPNDWHTQFEEPDNSCCNSRYPSDDESDDDICISDSCFQHADEGLKWESVQSHRIHGSFTTRSEQGMNYSRFLTS